MSQLFLLRVKTKNPKILHILVHLLHSRPHMWQLVKVITVGVCWNFYDKVERFRRGGQVLGVLLRALCNHRRRHILMLTRKWITVLGTTEDTSLTKLRIKWAWDVPEGGSRMASRVQTELFCSGGFGNLVKLWVNYVKKLATIRCRTFCLSRLLSKNLKIKIYRTIILPVNFVWVWNLVADIEGGKEAEGVWEHGVGENIWTYVGGAR